jgi:integrase
VEYVVSPFAGVKLPAREKIAVQEKPHSFLTLDDLKKFEETCLLTKKPGDGVTGVAIGAPIYGINAYACLLIVYTGLRIGELLGLKWKNIDMDKKELRVEATQKRVRDWDGESGGRYVWKVGETKTPTGYRIVPLSKKACDTIQLIKQCNTHQSPDDYVILSRNGKTPSESTMTRTLKGILIRAEIPDKGFGLHDLRHSFGSLLLEKGAELNKPVNMKYVSDLLGHKDVAFTSNIYIHATKEDKSSVVKLLDE